MTKELIPVNQDRASILARTPYKSSPRTSTPSNSPSAPPSLPTRNCQSIVTILLSQASSSCSHSCVDISSIDENIFVESEPLPGTMEATEKGINNKTRSLNRLMRTHPAGNINEETLGDYKDDLKEIQALLLDVVEEIENLDKMIRVGKYLRQFSMSFGSHV